VTQEEGSSPAVQTQGGAAAPDASFRRRMAVVL